MSAYCNDKVKAIVISNTNQLMVFPVPNKQLHPVFNAIIVI